MAEQSSLVVLLRALVMLLCLVMIPIAALFGTAIPSVVKALESGRLPTLAELRGPPPPAPGTSPAPGSTEAPRFVPGAATASAAPAWNSSSANVAANTPPAPSWPAPASVASGPPGSLPSSTVLANHIAPSGGGNSLGVVNASYNAPADPRPGDLAINLPSAGDPAARMKNRSSRIASGSVPPVGADPYTYVQNRLHEMGVTYFLLESWGDHNHEYRFYCKMAIGGNTEFTKAFWCVDADPKNAMMKVLQQVEGWHSSGG